MQSYKYEINTQQEHFQNFLVELPQLFEKSESTIHAARNTLKVIEYGGIEFVVKSFQVLHPIRRYIYTHWRDSKAKRSYHHALQLQKLDVSTPEPVAYIEFYRQGLLFDSYFVSKKVDYDFTIRAVLEEPFGEYSAALEPAAKFAADLHEKGVLHFDFSPGNLLIKKNDDDFKLYLVDLNRMSFKHINEAEGLQNLVRVMERQDPREKFIDFYSKYRNINAVKALALLNQYADKHTKRRELKSRLKSKIKNIIKRR